MNPEPFEGDTVSRQNKRPRPELIKVGDVWHVLCVLLIHTKNADGSPGLCKLIPETATVSLAGGEEFVTAYFPRHMIQGK